ncbi:MAG: hypothetical protein ACKOFC_03770 [Solirubrobacterales bacterium]
MASPSELPPDQLAVLRLLLTQSSSYSAIASSLHIQEREVQSRAVAALDSLAATEAPDAAERDATADYLLGQQDRAQEEKTRAMLAGSPAALAWARSLKAPLEEISGGSAPRLPEPGSPAARLSEDDDGVSAPRPAAAAAPAAAAPPRRAGRLLLAGLGAVAQIAVGLLVGRATAPDSNPVPAPGTNAAQRDNNAAPVAAARLKPPPGAPAPKALGIAQFARQQGQTILGVAAQDMPKTPKGSGYGVWMSGGSGEPLWLGYFSAVNNRGQVGAQAVVPVSPSAYKTLLITLESTRTPKSPGKTYLSGAITTAGG